MAERDQDKADRAPCFEEALDELERIVRELEEGKIGLAEGLARYEQGVALLKRCYQMLEQAERRIQVLNGVDSEGGEQSVPFDDSALSLDEKAQARGRRRSRAAIDENVLPPRDEIDGSGRLF